MGSRESGYPVVQIEADTYMASGSGTVSICLTARSLASGAFNLNYLAERRHKTKQTQRTTNSICLVPSIDGDTMVSSSPFDNGCW